MNAGIYKIENLINGKCYIGQSAELNKRKQQHFRMLENNKHENQHIQNSCNKYGKENFVFCVLLYCEPFELTHYEQLFVNIFHPEYNIRKECVDSNRGIKRSEESIQKFRLSVMGHSVSEETRRKLSLANSGKSYTRGLKMSEETKRKISLSKQNLSEEARRNISISAKRRGISEETRKKIGLAMKGRKLSEEHKRKISLGLEGRVCREETRQKIKLAHLGKPRSEETKQKLSLANIGKKQSKETKQKISMASKGMWERRKSQVQPQLFEV
jgi:group I intron endonuclease